MSRVYQHVCPVCNKEFESASKTSKYCSEACRLEAFYKSHGGSSAYRKSKYVPAAVRTPKRTCKWCNKEFQPRRADQFYCSDKCKFHVWNLTKRLKERHVNLSDIGCYGLPKRKCDVCGKIFSPKSSDQTRCVNCQIAPNYLQSGGNRAKLLGLK